MVKRFSPKEVLLVRVQLGPPTRIRSCYSVFMADPAFLKSVADYRKAGDTDEVIKEKLGHAGWSVEDINGALATSKLYTLSPVSRAVPVLPNSHKSKRDKKPINWFSDLITLVLFIAVVMGFYYIYVHKEFSVLNFQRLLPPSPLQNTKATDFTN